MNASNSVGAMLVERIAIVPVAEHAARTLRCSLAGEMPQDVRAQTLGAAVLHVVLQADVGSHVHRAASAQRLVEPHAAMALRIGAIDRLRPVVRHDALVGAGDVAAGRIVHVRQVVERNVALPLIGRCVGIAEARHDATADRDAAGHLVADMAVAHRHRRS